MISTPNAPDGLFEKIEREPEATCLYKRLFLDYTYGLDKIYTKQEIALARPEVKFFYWTKMTLTISTISYLRASKTMQCRC
jgi:hypothetical protein